MCRARVREGGGLAPFCHGRSEGAQLAGRHRRCSMGRGSAPCAPVDNNMNISVIRNLECKESGARRGARLENGGAARAAGPSLPRPAPCVCVCWRVPTRRRILSARVGGCKGALKGASASASGRLLLLLLSHDLGGIVSRPRHDEIRLWHPCAGRQVRPRR